MRAIVYRESGDTNVLQLIDRPEPSPSAGEVLVRIAVSGVNPTDWRSRRGTKPGAPLPFAEIVPNQDGAGTVVGLGEGVDPARMGQRVWIWEAAYQRANGTAQEIIALPQDHAVPLPDFATWDLGASLGIPALTAHRCLTVHEQTDGRLYPGSLEGKTVLIAGGAGAVGHAAIELALWSGAEVITTVSTPEKERLAALAGAHHVINYRTQDAAKAINVIASNGVDIIVEVAPHANADLDQAIIGRNSVVAVYASDSETVSIPIRASMVANVRFQYVMVYTVPTGAKRQAVADVQAALLAGALNVGQEAGLPLHHFSLSQTAAAHQAVERAAVGKVLINVGE
ncbi:MAG: NADPH:quinone reductase [Acidimicrobiaceae bacterium]|nr:NADPH:quinone reductase [Acidimicrobiaceae bacterium]